MNHVLDFLTFYALPPMVPLVVAGCLVVLLPVALLNAGFRRFLAVTLVLWIILPTIMGMGLFDTVTPWLIELGRFCYVFGVVGLTILVGHGLVRRQFASRRKGNSGAKAEASGGSDDICEYPACLDHRVG